MSARARNWLLGALLLLASLAVGVTYTLRWRAERAQNKIQEQKEQDAAQEERRKLDTVELADLKAKQDKIPTKSPDRTQDEVDAELRRRGHIK